MKINGISLKDLMLSFSLGQFQSVPQEAEIDHSFSEGFEAHIQRTNKKSQNAVWRFWQAPAKRIAVIAALIIAILVTAVLAFPIIRLAVFGHFIPQSPHIPQVTKTYDIPTFDPEGFTLLFRNRYHSAVEYQWINDQDEYIKYEQTTEPKDYSHLEATEGTTKTCKKIKGLSVEIISNETKRYLVATWSDNQYTYSVDINLNTEDPYPICEALIESLTAVGAGEQESIPTQTSYDNNYYSITENEGRYILTPKEPPEDPTGNWCASRAFFYPQFTSIGQMQQEIITGPISKHELFALCLPSQSENGEIEICNPNKLYECTAPDEFDLEYITWYRTDYTFYLAGDNANSLISCYDEESYTASFNNHYKEFLLDSPETLTKQTWTPNRFATVYYCNTGVAKLKYICYEISAGHKKMYIQEEYVLERQKGDVPVSDKVPNYVQFWGVEKGGYFEGLLYDLTERPSVEWLSQFGLVPYKD